MKTLPRGQRRNYARPSTTEPKVRITSSAAKSTPAIDTFNLSDELGLNDDEINKSLDENNNNLIKSKYDIDDELQSAGASDDEVDINDDEKYDTDIEAEGKLTHSLIQQHNFLPIK